MSQQFRHTPMDAQQCIPGNLMPTVGPPRTQIMFNSSQASYNITGAPPQHFVPTTIVYPPQLPNGQPRVPIISIPSGLQRVYVPVQQMPVYPISNLSVGQRSSMTDPTKLIEEQRKFEKERNFQLQQQRLKQFTIAGKKGSLNADNLIDSMFGKSEAKKVSAKMKTQKFDPVQSHHSRVQQPKDVVLSSVAEAHIKANQSFIRSNKVDYSGTQEIRKDPKVLESMMLECSDLSKTQKAKTFQKPLVKELLPTSRFGMTFAPSEKSRDWRNLQGLDKVFSAPKPRFPPWCKKEHVPALYHQVETLVTGDGSHPPDTNLLYPILLSSQLQCKLLGQIWELVNQTAPGHLTQEELYASLALVAVAQSGHPIENSDILHQFSSCPTPLLQCLSQSPIVPEQVHSLPADISAHSSVEYTDTILEAESPNSTHPAVRPTIIPIMDPLKPASSPCTREITICDLEKSVSSWGPFNSPDVGTPLVEDEFDDFKSATPTAVGALSIAPVSSVISVITVEEDDEFDDFKQAPFSTSTEPFLGNAHIAPHHSVVAPVANKLKIIDPDLMSPEEDKYSVFRMLQQTTEVDSGTLISKEINEQQLLVENVPNLFDCNVNDEQVPNFEQSFKNSSEEKEKVKHISFSRTVQEEDDFGDFLHADVTPAASVPAVSTPSKTMENHFAPDFADFSKLNDGLNSFGDFVTCTDGNNAAIKMSDEMEFGDFAGCQPVTLKNEIVQDFLFHHIRDNISLAESQSVSSLELGAFEGGGHSGESKSSLSRQGSIPSLDLKGVGLEGTDNEEGFGELQNASIRTSKSPSPSVDTNKSSEEKLPNAVIGFTLHPTSNLLLADKYSVIRSEKIKHEDQHISDWMRCLQSCNDILQNAKRVFNQMSCSSVCNEVLNSEEGRNYVKNVVEVYKVVCRISLASKSAGKQTDKLLQLLDEADLAWNTMTGFLTGSCLLPEEASLDFSAGVLRSDAENNGKACGLCLLSVDSKNRAFNKNEEIHKLTYGGRQYHSTCANLWVNCVDPLLPVLTLPQLL